MGLELVLSRIIADAQAEARRIEEQAASGSGKIVEEARRSAAGILSAAESSSRQRIAAMHRSELAKANAGIRIARLNAKNEVIGEVASSVSGELSRLSPSVRKKHYSRLLKLGAQEIEPKFFYCSAQDKELISSLAPSLSFAGEVPCLGGFILEDSERKVRVDYTFDALLERILSENKKALLKVLFDKNA